MQIQLHQSAAVQPDILKFSLVGDVTLVNDYYRQAMDSSTWYR